MKWRMLRSQMNVIVTQTHNNMQRWSIEMLTCKYVPVELLWKEPLCDAHT